jgi:hypothetical protein
LLSAYKRNRWEYSTWRGRKVEEREQTLKDLGLEEAIKALEIPDIEIPDIE